MNEPTIPKKIETLKTAILLPYARNSRTHSDAQIQQIASSIKEFGFTNPILIDENNQIIAGHGRLAAAHLLKIKDVPCIRLSHLTEVQKKAYVIADNKLALNAGWDDDLLALELKDLESEDFDLSLTGFSEEELAKLLVEAVEGQTDPDDVPEVQETAITVLGDIWTLGKHRLMCGDSTSIDAVEKLMNGQKADMIFTDPPYNIDYQGISKNHKKIINDKMNDSAFVDFLSSSLHGCEQMYVCCSWQYSHLFREAMIRIGRTPKAMIIWNKINPAQNLDKYFKQHEIIFYYGDFGGHKTIRGDVWSLKRQKNTVHPTMKPVELIEMAIQDQEGKKIVADYFGGSGSTLIACEKQNRECRMMELETKYCDVIIRRWQDFTGKKAIHSETGKTFDEMSNERSNNSSS